MGCASLPLVVDGDGAVGVGGSDDLVGGFACVVALDSGDFACRIGDGCDANADTELVVWGLGGRVDVDFF